MSYSNTDSNPLAAAAAAGMCVGGGFFAYVATQVAIVGCCCFGAYKACEKTKNYVMPYVDEHEFTVPPALSSGDATASS